MNRERETYSFVTPAPAVRAGGDDLKPPLRGALVIGGADETAVLARLRSVHADAAAGTAPPPAPPAERDLRAEVRIAVDYADAADLAAKIEKAIAALESGNPSAWKLLANQGVFHGEGAPQMVAFLYTGQGSQYINMLDTLRHSEPIVEKAFRDADAVMEPILGKPLTDYIFADANDPAAMEQGDVELRETEITQPAVLTVDLALTQLLAAYGVHPDMVMGHSLGEYGALVAAGALPYDDALHAVAGRGREMAHVNVEDRGLMAAVFAPIEDIQRALDAVDGYVVTANINSSKQAVIGGASDAVRQAMQILADHGAQVVPAPGESRIPHRDRGAGERPARHAAQPAAPRVTCHSARCERRRRVLPHGPKRGAEDDRDPGAADCIAGAVRERPPHPSRRRVPRVRRGGPEEGAAGIRHRRTG